MKRSVLAVLLVVVCATLVVCNGGNDAFFKGDYYGVTWGMTKEEVMKAFEGDVVEEFEDARLYQELGYIHKENGRIVGTEFKFDSGGDRILTEILFGKGSIYGGTELKKVSLQEIEWHTNRLVQKFGMWEKFEQYDGYSNSTNTVLKWRTSRTIVKTELRISDNPDKQYIETSYKPIRKYIK
jgi:hypothetical protein